MNTVSISITVSKAKDLAVISIESDGDSLTNDSLGSILSELSKTINPGVPDAPIEIPEEPGDTLSARAMEEVGGRSQRDLQTINDDTTKYCGAV